MPQSLFPQNVIAIIWDFDKTLSPCYMQQPLFRKFGVTEVDFFAESDGLEEVYKKDGVENVSKDLLYLNHILTYVRTGVFAGLNNRMLFKLGYEIELYEGLPDFFPQIRSDFSQTPYFKKEGITIEHYIVSTGLRQMILGSKIMGSDTAPYVNGVWGCEFFESNVQPGYRSSHHEAAITREAVIQGIAYSIDKTSKTRALFEINKGTNKAEGIDVNATMALEDRRVPFRNMIYVGDGPSDVPAFSIVNQLGGRTFAVPPCQHS